MKITPYQLELFLHIKPATTMKTMLLFSFFLFINTSFSQIKKKDLIGEWHTDKELFYKADTIKFYKESEICHQIVWEIERRKFHSGEFMMCKEPTKGIVRPPILEKMKLRKKDFGQIIELYQNDILADKFRIVSLQKSNNLVLKLIRFDKLSEHKLYKYVDSLIYKVLKYKPEVKKDKAKADVSKSKSPAKRNEGYQISCLATVTGNPKPFLVINGIPFDNREILKELLLVETYYIKCFTRPEATALYGYEAFNGVIILRTSEKRFKKVSKKYRK